MEIRFPATGLKFMMAESRYDSTSKSLPLETAIASTPNIPKRDACVHNEFQRQLQGSGTRQQRATCEPINASTCVQLWRHTRSSCLCDVGIASSEHVAQQNASGTADKRFVRQRQLNARSDISSKRIYKHLFLVVRCQAIDGACKQGHDYHCTRYQTNYNTRSKVAMAEHLAKYHRN